MVTNQPSGDNARKGAVRKHTQLRTKVVGENHWTTRRGNRQVHGSKECAGAEQIPGHPPREEGQLVGPPTGGALCEAGRLT